MPPTRILVLGGGFGGIHAAVHLEKTLRADPNVEVTLVSRDNFFLFTPMLHEVAASDLDIPHIVSPIRTLLRRTSVFVGDVESVDLRRRRVVVSHGFERHSHELEYDQVVVALGSITNFYGLPGLEQRALTMKTLGDAIHLRNRVIATLEEGDTECAAKGDGLLTFVVAGGGFAGVETRLFTEVNAPFPRVSGGPAAVQCSPVLASVQAPRRARPLRASALTPAPRRAWFAFTAGPLRTRE